MLKIIKLRPDTATWNDLWKRSVTASDFWMNYLAVPSSAEEKPAPQHVEITAAAKPTNEAVLLSLLCCNNWFVLSYWHICKIWHSTWVLSLKEKIVRFRELLYNWQGAALKLKLTLMLKSHKNGFSPKGN